MELNTVRRQISVLETFQDEFGECPIDSSFVLPDYCPDVAAVLKCTLRPSVLSRQISGDRLIADGQTIVHILYLDEERTCVRCFEFTVPFAYTFPLKEVGAECETTIHVKPDYVNCRALSPRRLDIHGTVTVHLVRTGHIAKEIVGSFDDETVCCKRETMQWTIPIASAEKSFTVNEVLELGNNHLPAKSLLRSDVVANATETRLLNDKAIVKGELRMKNVYVTDEENGTIDCVRHSIPFSQIIDLPGSEENAMLCTHLDPVVCEVHITADPNGANTLLTVAVKVTASLNCYHTESCETITDAYSTLCPLLTEKKAIDTVLLTDIAESMHTIQETVSLPDGTQKILDLWCSVIPETARFKNGQTYIDSHINLCLLACNSDNQVGYYERALDVTLEFEGCYSKVVPLYTVLDVEYQVGAEGKLEVKVRLCVRRLCYKEQHCLCITRAEMDETNAYPPHKTTLKVYYAAKGETIWNIAQRCHTTTDKICTENSISEEALSRDTMLLIPYC